MWYFDLLTGTFYYQPDPSPSGETTGGSPVARSSGLDEVYGLWGEAQAIFDGALPTADPNSGLAQVYDLWGQAQNIVTETDSLTGSDSTLNQVYNLWGQAEEIFAGAIPITGGDSTMAQVYNLWGQATQHYTAGTEIINAAPISSNNFGSNLLGNIGSQVSFINNSNTSIEELAKFTRDQKYKNQIAGNSVGLAGTYNSINAWNSHLGSRKASSYGTFGDGYAFNPETGKTQWYSSSEGFIS